MSKKQIVDLILLVLSAALMVAKAVTSADNSIELSEDIDD